MTSNWKLVGGFSAFALLIAVLTGIIAGNPFGTILVRALLASVLFGALGIGVGYMIGKYLPELDLPGMSSTNEEASTSEVNIVVPEENPHLHTDTDGIIEVEGTEIEGTGDNVESEEDGGQEEAEAIEEGIPNEMKSAPPEKKLG